MLYNIPPPPFYHRPESQTKNNHKIRLISVVPFCADVTSTDRQKPWQYMYLNKDLEFLKNITNSQKSQWVKSSL